MEGYSQTSGWEERCKLEKAKRLYALVNGVRHDRVTDEMAPCSGNEACLMLSRISPASPETNARGQLIPLVLASMHRPHLSI
jgi:hypothetical protein